MTRRGTRFGSSVDLGARFLKVGISLQKHPSYCEVLIWIAYDEFRFLLV